MGQESTSKRSLLSWIATDSIPRPSTPVKYDITLVPAMAIGGFGGLRPAEIHG
ncbi:MAG: hypothetical protein NTZ46_00895 [Verrucomicrobia bacterium]|nr:hypothetical protein [Verrucomicrobiota bacterium]